VTRYSLLSLQVSSVWLDQCNSGCDDPLFADTSKTYIDQIDVEEYEHFNASNFDKRASTIIQQTTGVDPSLAFLSQAPYTALRNVYAYDSDAGSTGIVWLVDQGVNSGLSVGLLNTCVENSTERFRH
jgi:hypothetical protein